MAGQLHGEPDLTMGPETERPPLLRALSKEPAERWPSCRAFVDALRTAAAGETKTGARRAWPQWTAWAALALLALLLSAGVLVVRCHEGKPPENDAQGRPGPTPE
jgi:hypothetical protein